MRGVSGLLCAVLLLVRDATAFQLSPSRLGCALQRSQHLCSLRSNFSPWHQVRPVSMRLSTPGQDAEASQEEVEEGTFAAVSVTSPADSSTEAFRVVPPGGEAGPKDIIIQPGLGWGEGQHPSTYMCLQFAWEQVSGQDSPSFLDYGTGSGVLAICAKKFGASRVVGIDKDDEILEHAEENGQLNGVEDGLELLNGRELMPSSGGLYIADAFSPTTFDVVIANMLPAALIKLASFISLGVKEDSGILGLSGIRHDQVQDVRDAFGMHGIVFDSERRKVGAAPGAKKTEYVLLIGHRPARSEEEKAAYAAFLAETAVA